MVCGFNEIYICVYICKTLLKESVIIRKGRITIYEINGRKVQEETIKERATRFSINGSGTGIYMVKVDVDGGNSRTKKVYIE